MLPMSYITLMYDRKATENQIIDAVDRLIRQSGAKAVGVNSVAREADCSKVLIYRYFGGLEGLLEAWALKNSYWMDVSDDITEIGNLKEGVRGLISGMAESLMKQPSRRAVLRWLLEEETKAGKRVMERLETRGVELTRNFLMRDSFPRHLDIEAIMALITAGINYLAILSDRADVYNGIPLNDPEGWKRLSRGIAELFPGED